MGDKPSYGRETNNLRAGEAAAKLSTILSAEFEISANDLERTVVIARCGIRHRAARPERRSREQGAMTASLKKRASKVFELWKEEPQRGSPGRRKLNVFAK
jgi:hypothetical protein